MGRGSKLPPQLGQVLFIAATQGAQNVHSKVQMRASGDVGGRSLSQRSQLGLSSSMLWDVLVCR